MVLTLSPATSVKKSPAYISMRGNMVEGGSALAIGERKVISTDQNILLDLSSFHIGTYPYSGASVLRTQTSGIEILLLPDIHIAEQAMSALFPLSNGLKPRSGQRRLYFSYMLSSRRTCICQHHIWMQAREVRSWYIYAMFEPRILRYLASAASDWRTCILARLA